MLGAALRCTMCGAESTTQRSNPRCGACREPLELVFAPAGKPERRAAPTLLERFRYFFPFRTIHPELSLGEGGTPLTRSTAIAGELGCEALYFKNETLNPTWSFKDRGTITGIEHALSMGFEKIGTVSTGNMAASVAAYGARAGLETYIFVSSKIGGEKLLPIAVYDPRLIVVECDYGELYFRSIEIGEMHGIYFINSDVPQRVEGSKTIAFEICDQLGRAPDTVILPVSSGGNFRGVLKGFEEYRRTGLVDKIPRMVAVQASGCAPIARALQQGKETVERWATPSTIAKAIANPFPPSGNAVLRKLRETEGIALAVADAEITEAQEMLASEGIFGQPASAVPLAGLRKLREQNLIRPDENVVCIITGTGLKYTSVLESKSFQVRTATLETLVEVL